ncbi:MAG: YfcC family protein [Firmicutes bacterium]|jgi:uncharacterized ion transporter superfamily protein YfcC|nr:YfcC family protein [Bacillota bacterium]
MPPTNKQKQPYPANPGNDEAGPGKFKPDLDSGIRIGKKVFVSSMVILLTLMLVAGILTYVIPSGSYDRTIQDGREIIVADSFKFMERPDYSPWRWLIAPIEVIGSEDSLMILGIILFIIIIGGAFSVMDRAGVMKAVINRTVGRFGQRRYLLMALIVFFLMSLGAFLGIFEEVIPLVPIIVALSYRLGWDSLTGLGMSLMASAFGFSAAVSNPFTVGIAQRLAGLPAFSGFAFRIIVFLVIYVILVTFLYRHIRKIEKDPRSSPVYREDLAEKEKYSGVEEALSPEEQIRMSKAIRFFAFMILLLLAMLVVSSFVPLVADLSFPLIALLFLIGGLGASVIAGIKFKEILLTFGWGIAKISPGIILILMAVSVKFIITQGGIMDSILYYASEGISRSTPYQAVIMIYGLVLALNFFIASGSAKAFLVMPIIAPLADLMNVTRQTSVLAFVFGDGFSNVIYPSNPGLLIVLGLTVVSYVRWFKWSVGLQLLILAVTSSLLLLAVKIGLGPF